MMMSYALLSNDTFVILAIWVPETFEMSISPKGDKAALTAPDGVLRSYPFEKNRELI